MCAAQSLAMAIITIGPRTDAIIDDFALPHSFILDLRNMTCTICSSSWIRTLQAEWGFDHEQALMLSRALLADIKADSLKVRTLITLIPWCLYNTSPRHQCTRPDLAN
jgi:hypothetical protein